MAAVTVVVVASTNGTLHIAPEAIYSQQTSTSAAPLCVSPSPPPPGFRNVKPAEILPSVEWITQGAVSQRDRQTVRETGAGPPGRFSSPNTSLSIIHTALFTAYLVQIP